MKGDRLSELRKIRGLNRKELADKLGLSEFTIRSYEQGKSEPDDETKIKISQLFDVSLDYLIGSINIEMPLLRPNYINLPTDFPKELISEAQKYIGILLNDYKYRNQKK